MLREKDIVAIDGKMKAVSVFVTNQLRIMENTIAEIHSEMLRLSMYLEFRRAHMLRNPKLPADWQGTRPHVPLFPFARAHTHAIMYIK